MLLSLILGVLKLIHPHQNMMDEHGPIFVLAAVMIVAGIQMLAIGLLGELQVRHYHTSNQRAPYAIDRLVRLRAPEGTKPALRQLVLLAYTEPKPHSGIQSGASVLNCNVSSTSELRKERIDCTGEKVGVR